MHLFGLSQTMTCLCSNIRTAGRKAPLAPFRRYQSSDAALAAIRMDSNHRSRYFQHYADTLATDLLYMNYDHSVTENPPSAPKLPSWDPSNPFTKNRPRPRVTGRNVLQPTAKPTTDENITRLESITVSIHVKQAPGQSDLDHGKTFELKVV